MLVQTRGMESETKRYCKDVSIVIRGVEFLADLILLTSQRLDVILGMDWLAKYDWDIRCKDKAVHLITTEGLMVTSTASQPNPIFGTLNHIETPSLDQVPGICEYLDVFLEELHGMPPNRDLEFVIELVPGTAPIAKRP